MVPVAGFCEHDNESVLPIACDEFLDQLSCYHVLKESALCSLVNVDIQVLKNYYHLINLN